MADDDLPRQVSYSVRKLLTAARVKLQGLLGGEIGVKVKWKKDDKTMELEQGWWDDE